MTAPSSDPLFDAVFYLRTNPDVAAAGVDPYQHYIRYGAEEGRDPHPLFDTSYYAGQANLRSNENPIVHYCEDGSKRGLSPHPLFDVSFYLRENPDVAAEGINPFLHYLSYGWLENRDPHALFDNRYYRAQYDSRREGISPLHHYVTQGSRLGLRPHLLFDGEFYLRKYPDVTNSGESSLGHYLRLGHRLNYSPNEWFDVERYREIHGGKIPAGMSPIQHLAEFGDYAEIAPLMREPFVDAPVADSSSPLPEETQAKLIAFYLPQYHAIPENDLWWGKGFTDWRNVARAVPLFDGHYQPRVPADLGYYDLSLPGVQEQQAELAREYGIHGFCFYYYWFDGYRLLEGPLQQRLARRSPNFPFCICWANERWSRRWDASPHEILIEQNYSEGFAERFIRDALPFMTDRHYIQVGGAPLLLVYHVDEIPDIQRVADSWRRIFLRETGLELHLAMLDATRDPRFFPAAVGFDSMVEFAPRLRNSILDSRLIPGLRSDFAGHFDDYRELVRRALLKGPTDCPYYRCVMPGWDNTPRRGIRARIVINGDADAYQTWLRSAVARGMSERDKQDPLVFIFAWNEWAEGAYLEPDQRDGHRYLQATRDALREGVADITAHSSKQRAIHFP